MLVSSLSQGNSSLKRFSKMNLNSDKPRNLWSIPMNKWDSSMTISLIRHAFQPIKGDFESKSCQTLTHFDKMKIEFLLFGVATAFSDCKGPRKHFKIGKSATIQCSHATKSCDINCEFGVKVCYSKNNLSVTISELQIIGLFDNR